MAYEFFDGFGKDVTDYVHELRRKAEENEALRKRVKELSDLLAKARKQKRRRSSNIPV